MITRENDKDSFPRRAKGQLSSTGKKTPGESPGNTRDTHGTHGRTRAHGSHRQTSQPSKPNDTSSTGIERAFNHHAWLRTSHVPLNSNTSLARRSLNAVTACTIFSHLTRAQTRSSAFLGALLICRCSRRFQLTLPLGGPNPCARRSEQGHPTNSTTDHA